MVVSASHAFAIALVALTPGSPAVAQDASRVIAHGGLDLFDGYETPHGVVSVRCVNTDDGGFGTTQYRLDEAVLNEGGSCHRLSEPPTLESDVIYPSGERIVRLLSGSGRAGVSGAAIRLVAGEAPRLIPIDYMIEWSEPGADPDHLRYVVFGLRDEGETFWVCEADVDWSAGRVTRTRLVEGDGDC